MSVQPVRFPNESADYRAARDELLRAEMDLRKRVEDVAAKRRRLPVGSAVPEDYVFEEGGDGKSVRRVRLSELFVRPEASLLLLTNPVTSGAVPPPSGAAPLVLELVAGMRTRTPSPRCSPPRPAHRWTRPLHSRPPLTVPSPKAYWAAVSAKGSHCLLPSCLVFAFTLAAACSPPNVRVT